MREREAASRSGWPGRRATGWSLGAPRALARLGLCVLAGLPACRARESGPAGAPAAAVTAPAPASAPAQAGSAPAPSPAQRAYEEAQRAILAEQDLETGIARLEQAVALDPGFGEAWYQLGTARLTVAAAARTVDPADALARFRSGVADCRRALDLAQRGSLRLWDAFELADAVADLRESLALVGDDAGLADDLRARAALDRWAESKGFEPGNGGAPAAAEEQP